MDFLLTLMAPLLAIATVLPLSTSRQWYIRALDFPRVQIATLAIVWLILWALQSESGSAWLTLCAASMLAVLGYQLYWIIPNTQLHAVEIEPCVPHVETPLATVRLLSSNVLMHNRNAAALVNLVRRHQPDILVTLESDQWWQDQLDTLDDYPHRLACPLDNLYGMHIYSRLEFTDARIEYLVEDDKPSMNLVVRLDEQHSVKLHVVHPAPPAPQENDTSTERDVELICIARSVASRSEPVIVAGDLNDVAWSATTRLFREISGLKDPRVGRGLFNTFNARHWFVRWPLDHVFVSKHFRLVDLQRLDDIGSDHFPLLVELALVQTRISTDSNNTTPSEPELLEEILDTDVAKQASAPA